MNRKTWDDIIKYGAYSQELDWFAFDNKGNLGVFTAVMNASIPEKVKSSFENYLQLKHEFELLPKITNAVLETSEQGDLTDWIGNAEKGLFAFDFQDIHRMIKKNQYDLIARPATPLNLKDLNITSDLLSSITKLECDFRDGNLKTEIIL